MRRAFTLIELLVVIGVVALLAGILYPVYASARRKGSEAVSLSNLHQCGLTLAIYASDEGGTFAIPPAGVVDDVMKGAPTCDPRDDWRPGCHGTFGSPLVGSYAYVRKVAPMEEESGWSWYTGLQPNPTTMLSVFHGSHRVVPFHGSFPPDALCVTDPEGCHVPDRVLRLRLDGSAKSEPVQVTIEGGTKLVMNFAHLFLNDTFAFQ